MGPTIERIFGIRELTMIMSKTSRFLIASWAVSCSTLFCQTVPQDRARAELDRAIRARLEASYPDFCQGLGSGRIFDVQNQEIRIDGNTATVSYVLVVFESCEEGAPYQAFRETETWIRRTNAWKPVERCTGPKGREDQNITSGLPSARLP